MNSCIYSCFQTNCISVSFSLIQFSLGVKFSVKLCMRAFFKGTRKHSTTLLLLIYIYMDNAFFLHITLRLVDPGITLYLSIHCRAGQSSHIKKHNPGCVYMNYHILRINIGIHNPKNNQPFIC